MPEAGVGRCGGAQSGTAHCSGLVARLWPLLSLLFAEAFAIDSPW